MNPSLTEPPAQAACSDTDEGIRLAFVFQDVVHEITGKPRWLGNQTLLKHGQCRWMWVFKKLVGQLRIWKFSSLNFLRWAISTQPDVIERPNMLVAEWLLDKYRKHCEGSMTAVVTDDKVLRGKLDLIRSRMEADVEFLASWVKLQPDYKQRLLNQYHALSPHFLATDTVFLDLLNEGRIVNRKTVEDVTAVILELNGDKWFYQQVRTARDNAIRMAAGK